jgi:anti-sigma B factor antagonist
MPARQCLEISETHGITMAHLLDDRLIERNGIEDVGKALCRLIESDGRRKLVVTFSSVEFISSGDLGQLVVLHKRVNAHGATLRFCCMRPEVHGGFAITKLDRLFGIRESEADALAAFN